MMHSGKYPDAEKDSARDYKRKMHYMTLKGYKQGTCTACNGSGYYDNYTRGTGTPQCGCCDGTGVEWVKEQKNGSQNQGGKRE